MTTTKSAEAREDAHNDNPNLDTRYGKIGISAVAAAVRFRSEARDSSQARSFHYDFD